MTPPRLPRALLRLAAPAADRAVILGDLDEEFRARLASGGARAWYWRQAIASLPAALRLRLHRASPLADLAGDFRLAVRLLARQPGFTAAAVSTMTLGAGITTGVVSVVDTVLLRPLPYANADRLYAVNESDGMRHGSNMSWSDFLELSSGLRSFAALAAYDGGSRTMTGLGPAERLSGTYVTPRFFSVLGVQPSLGRDFTDADALRGAPSVVVLSDAIWRRRFDADRSVIGRTVALSGEIFTVIGVLPPTFVFPQRANPELWMPLRPSPQQEERAYLHFVDVIAVRAPGVSPAMVADEMRRHSVEWQTHGAVWHQASTLQAVPLGDDITAGIRSTLLLLFAAALLVLLTAAANVAGLVLVRAAGREREVAVRSALGATRLRLVRQFVVEAVCLALLGSALGVAVGYWGLQTFDAVMPQRFRAGLPSGSQIGVSLPAALASAALTIAAVVAASVWPALRSARSAASFVRAPRGGDRAETRVRAALVAGQIALAVMLLAGALLVARSVMKLSQVSPGFEIAGLVSGRVSLPPARYGGNEATVAAVDRILEAARAVPGVSGAEAINQLPLTGLGNTGDFTIVGRAVTPSSNPLIRDVTPGYFSLMPLRLIEGRPLQPSDTASAPRAVVVNRTLARFYFPDGGAVGQQIVFAFFDGRPAWTIVGVVGDEQFGDLDQAMPPVVYFPFAQDPEGSFSLVVRTSLPDSSADALRAAVAAVDPELPLYETESLVRMAAHSTPIFVRSVVTRLLAWFSVAALLLAGVAIYGVLAEAIAARTREIGVRLALGATPPRIARLVMRTGLAPAAAGLVAGAACTALAAPAVRSLLFGVSLLDLPSLAGVLAAIAAVSLAACAVPIRRALRVPIATALRE